MNNEKYFRSVAPQDIASARIVAHRAAQHLTRAARANLESQPDDGHSNLGWDSKTQAFLSQTIDGKHVGLRLYPLTIFVVNEDLTTDTLNLNDISDDEVASWLDGKLTSKGLKAASVITLPYNLPKEVNAVESYGRSASDQSLRSLGAWFDAASQQLEKFASNNSDITPGPSPVRCWPHHFDLATYVSLQAGDPETAQGIGVGMSPGDDGYNEPYFYINPWPHLDKANLPDAIYPGHWHVENYVGSIATATELMATDDVENSVANFIVNSFETGRTMLNN